MVRFQSGFEPVPAADRANGAVASLLAMPSLCIGETSVRVDRSKRRLHGVGTED